MNKKAREKFMKEFSAYISKFGVESNKDAVPDSRYKFTVDTPVGKLHISPDPALPREKVSSIFCMFAEPKRAEGVYPECNTYTGKWNFHDFSAEGVMGVFKHYFEALLKVDTKNE